MNEADMILKKVMYVKMNQKEVGEWLLLLLLLWSSSSSSTLS